MISVLPLFRKQKEKGELTITDKEMTRFWITLDQCFDLVSHALNNSVGGEIFVPKVPAMKTKDLFKALAPNRDVFVTGIRPGEKIHEVLITKSEVPYTFDIGKYFVILPASGMDLKIYNKYTKSPKLNFKEFGSNNTNGNRLKKEELMKIVYKK